MILPLLNEKQKDSPTHLQLLSLIDTLFENTVISRDDLLFLLDHISKDEIEYLYEKAYEKKYMYYQNRVFMRGLLEISNICLQGCLYCGINHKNKNVHRYRLSKEEILQSVQDGYSLGYKTFVLQGGEDKYYSDDILVDIIKSIKTLCPDARITLSLGERSKESYLRLYEAGADRYLLRHETASKRLYQFLHPTTMTFEGRMKSLHDLQDIGYQVGAGFMVNTPTQTNTDLVEDLLFLHSFEPDMIGIGPFLAHSETSFKDYPSGTLEQSLVMVALTRLMVPKALLPATTALGTLHKIGREKALKVGANVLMPNISPTANRKDYEIYENKICVDDTVDACRNCIEGRVIGVNHIIDLSVGDPIYWTKK